MAGKFTAFLRRRIGVLIVFTLAVNMIMFSTILAYTGSIPSEQGTVVFRKHKVLQNYSWESVEMPTRKPQNIKQILTNQLQEKKVKRPTDEKGQMDYVPSNRLKSGNVSSYFDQRYGQELNQSDIKPPKNLAKARKQAAIEQIMALANDNSENVYHMYDDNFPAEVVQHDVVMKHREKLNDNGQPPNTFNAKYIEYFWRHPELRNKQDRIKVINSNPDTYNEKVKAIQGEPAKKVVKGNTYETDFEGAEIGNYAVNQKKSNVTISERVNQEYRSNKKELQNLSYITMFPAKGQLGNQMFQLASLLGIADAGNFTPFLSKSEFDVLNKVFMLPKGFSRKVEMAAFDHFLEEQHSQNDSIKLTQSLDRHRNWTLEGYFQSYKYFRNVHSKLRKYLRFQKFLKKRAVEFLKGNVPDGHVKVAIHIRRGDFISPYQMKLGRVAATTEYIQRAMQYFQSRYKNITFIVVSDEIRWCRNNIRGDNVKYSTSAYNQNSLDLAIISQCDHVIISVGSFGWWGGWLSGGTVIYFDQFPTPGSELDKTFVPKNYYPDQWIGLH